MDDRFWIDNLLVRIHFIIEMMRWTGLAPWEFEFPFSRKPFIYLLTVYSQHLSTCLKQRARDSQIDEPKETESLCKV